MLKLTNIKKTFNPGTITEKKALKGIDLTLEDGDFVTVIGGNGAGKSTLLNLIAGVHYADTGSIELDGMNLTENAARLTPYYVDKEFLLKMITSDFMQSQFIDKTHQVGQPKLALFRLKDSLIPVPPLNEQKRIVQKLKELSPQIDVLRTETK